MNYFFQNEPVTSVTASVGLPKSDERKEPTERQLEWMRENIPHFATCEKQARTARGKA